MKGLGFYHITTILSISFFFVLVRDIVSSFFWEGIDDNKWLKKRTRTVSKVFSSRMSGM